MNNAYKTTLHTNSVTNQLKSTQIQSWKLIPPYKTVSPHVKSLQFLYVYICMYECVCVYLFTYYVRCTYVLS